MASRSPFDGLPYYCAFCNCGFGEYLACDQARCELESVDAAECRMRADQDLKRERAANEARSKQDRSRGDE